MSTDDCSRRGRIATQKLYEDFLKLLDVLGHGKLVLDSGLGSNPATVPETCEKTNLEVTQLLSSMKTTINEIRESYAVCQQLMKMHGKSVLNLDVMTSQQLEISVEKPSEHHQLMQQLKLKNDDLKHLMNEIEIIFSHINQLGNL